MSISSFLGYRIFTHNFLAPQVLSMILSIFIWNYINKKTATIDYQYVAVYCLWAHLDLNQGPTDYESVALTI